jgi:fatty-acyl-CoA synthase
MYELSERTIGQWLDHWAANDPDKDYIVYPDRNLRWSFRYFQSRVDELARGLLAIGIRRGSHVGIWAANVPDWLTVFFACAKIGAVTVTVNTNFKKLEVEDICRRADLEALCIGDHAKDNDLIAITYDLLPGLRALAPFEPVASEALPRMRRVLYFGTESHRGMLSIGEVMAAGMTVSEADYAAACAPVQCRDLANIQYTSGTTGRPKGAMLSHYGICNNGALTGVHLNFNENTRLCLCLPFFHCFGLVLGVLNCLVHHCTMVVTENYNPLLVLASISKERCTHLYGVPTMFLGLLNHPMFNLFDLKSLRSGIMAGSIVPVALAKRVESEMFMKLTTEYGFTEASAGMTATRWDEPFDIRIGTVGKEFEFTEVKVLDEQGNEVPDGTEGELCNRGYNNMLGYYDDPEGTGAVQDANGFLHTGDLGFKDRDGYFHVTGRKVEMIIRGGENIYPHEVESYIYRFPGIKIAQVVGIPSPKYGESVCAFIEREEGCEALASDIRDFCRANIARYKVPKYIFFLGPHDWPLTGSGKIQKFKLKEMAKRLCEEQGIAVV